MVYHSFDRQILVAVESTEGSNALTSPAASNFIDTLTDVDVDFNVVRHDRDLVRPGWTPVPDFMPSTDFSTSGSLVATATISFTVEMSLKTDGTSPVDSAPGWGALLRACGCRQDTAVQRCGAGSFTVDRKILNNEYLTVIGVDEGQAIGTAFDGDSYVYYTIEGTGISNTDTVIGSVTGTTFTAGSDDVPVGIAYRPDSTTGYGDGTSLSIMLWWAGRRYTFVGCRGSVSKTFSATNRVLMSFTLQGIMDTVANGDRFTGVSYGHAIPSVFNDATLKMNEHGGTAFTSALFSQITWDMGNEVVFREDANSATGHKAAQIVGRAGTVNIDPDAVLGGTTSATALDFFEKLAEGTDVRAEWKVGDGMDTYSTLFRMPALRFNDIGISDRDKIEVFDLTADVTGGWFGDSVTQADGDVQNYSDRGADNEFSIVLY